MKLKKTVPINEIYAVDVAEHSSVFNYGPPEKGKTDNRGCFTSKIFQDACPIMNVENN